MVFFRYYLTDLILFVNFTPNQVNIPNACNACSGFDNSFGWTFFDLNAIHDDQKDSSVTVLQADFVSIPNFFASHLVLSLL